MGDGTVGKCRLDRKKSAFGERQIEWRKAVALESFKPSILVTLEKATVFRTGPVFQFVNIPKCQLDNSHPDVKYLFKRHSDSTTCICGCFSVVKYP